MLSSTLINLLPAITNCRFCLAIVYVIRTQLQLSRLHSIDFWSIKALNLRPINSLTLQYPILTSCDLYTSRFSVRFDHNVLSWISKITFHRVTFLIVVKHWSCISIHESEEPSNWSWFYRHQIIHFRQMKEICFRLEID